MKSRNRCHGITFLVVLAFLVPICHTAPVWGMLEVGEHIPLMIDTPRDYAGAAGSEEESVWGYELSHPGATYIAIHFIDFDLGPNDYLIVSDAGGEQFYTLEGKGKKGAGTFWAQHIKGDRIILELVAVSKDGGRGFLIDEYVAGNVDIGAAAGMEAICGIDDKKNAACYQASYPTEYQRGRAVARLLINGSGLCTGWLASANGHLITNEHCITSAADALNTDYEFMAEAPNCSSANCQLCFAGDIFSGATFIQDNVDLDYALVEINNGNPAATYGYLEIDNRSAVVGEQIYIPQHPGGQAKEFAINSTDDHDTGGVCRVFSITQPGCGRSDPDVGYYADTEGGSSGSPVLAASSHKVIALHHCANCPNRGVPINLIYTEIKNYLGPPDDLSIAPTEGFNSSGDEGGPFTPPCKIYTLTNVNDIDPLDWTATATQPWLDVTPGNGTLAGGASTTVDVCINANANTLSQGHYTDTVTFSNLTSGYDQTRGVELFVGTTGKMYWVDSGTDKIQRANLDGSNIEDLVTTGLSIPRGIAVDLSASKMYWADYGTDKIQRANLDGSNVEDLVTTGLSGPWGIALDPSGGKMYWIDASTDKIWRANLDGSNVENLISTGLGEPYNIALDLSAGKMYWADYGTDKIQRANLDGSNVEDLVTVGLSGPLGIALDSSGGKMYWTEYSYDKIQRANLDGSNVEDLVTTGLSAPWDIALDPSAGKMYWTDYGTDKIQRANLDGSNVEDLITTGLLEPAGITISQFVSIDDLQVEPQEGFNSSGKEEGPFTPACKTYTLTNNDDTSLGWDANATCDWVDIIPSSGTLLPGSPNSVEAEVCINDNANDLYPGTHNCTVTFTNTSSGFEQERDVTLEVINVLGQIEVTDSIPEPNDHNMPFGEVIVDLSRTERVTITNLDPNPRHEVCIEDIYLESAFYSEDFSSGLPGSSEGWEFFKQGRIEVVSGKMRMYSYYSGYDLSEAILNLDLAGKNNVVLSFWQGRSSYEDSHYLPATFTGHSYGDGVAISAEGDRLLGSRRWYTIVNAGDLYTSGRTFTIYLDAEVERIRRDYDPDFGYSGDFCIKFQQYDNFSDEYREWDDIYVYWDDAFSIYPPPFSDPNTNTWTLAGGESMVVDVNFAPTDFIDYNNSHILIQANIVIDANNDPNNQVEISMSGTGIPEYLDVACVNDVEFAGHPGGPFMPTWSSCDLTNNGPIDVNWSVNGPNWLDVDPNSGTLPPDANTIVTFWPNGIADTMPEGIYDANLVFIDETTTIEQQRKIRLVVYTTGKICVDPMGFDILVPQGNIVSETLTIGNCGDANLSYTVSSSDESWLGVSQNSGTAGPGDVNQITVTFNGNREVGTSDANLLITSNDPYNTAIDIPATMSIIGVDYFTEIFDPNENDVSNLSVTFAPDDSGSYYRACGDMVSEFPVDPTGGTTVSLGDDDYISVPLVGASINFYGDNHETFYIGSNGYITFESGDFRYFENLSEHFELPRIAALWDDLDPSSGGTVSWKQLDDRIAVTFESVPELYTVNSNSFQIEMFYDGHIRITWLNIAATDGLVGLSDGYGEPAFYGESDMSGYSDCIPMPGELNDDFHVDMIDFAIFSLCWQKHESLMETVRDEFNAVDYSGNDGSLNWSNSWIEYGEVDGPASGVLQVLADGAMRIGKKGSIGQFNWSLTREADLGTATTATLRFDYAITSHGNSGFVNVQVSDDGGFNWYTLAVYPHNASSGSASYDISSWISSNTQIRFEADPSVKLRMFFNVDNVEIEYGDPDQPWYLWCNGSDFDRNFRVDADDLRILCEHWLE